MAAVVSTSRLSMGFGQRHPSALSAPSAAATSLTDLGRRTHPVQACDRRRPLGQDFALARHRHAAVHVRDPPGGNRQISRTVRDRNMSRVRASSPWLWSASRWRAPPPPAVKPPASPGPNLPPVVADLAGEAPALQGGPERPQAEDLGTYAREIAEMGRLLQQADTIEKGSPAVSPSPGASPVTLPRASPTVSSRASPRADRSHEHKNRWI
jgi:hypothetical protein